MILGKLIVFEGVNGAGKTTQIDLCQEWLDSLGFPVATTFEPGGTELGAELRKLLLDPTRKIPELAELLIYAADRADHVQSFIIPAIDAGKIVLCDRFTLSTLAYQGYGRRMGKGLIRWLNHLTTKGIEPTITLWFDIDPQIGLSRKTGALDRLEQEDFAFHERVHNGYCFLATNPNIHRIDAIQPEAVVHGQIKSIVSKTFQSADADLSLLTESPQILQTASGD